MARTLDEWLDWQSSQHPRTIELGLERMHEMLARLPVQRPHGPVIVVAGTNGKGSVAAYVEALLAEGGRRVGTYTSPHLVRYNERVRVAGVPVSDETLCAAFATIEEVRQGLALTFFEYGTLAAFVAFTAAKLDAWVLEIGLGGRLDAVNAIDSDAAIVVSIGLDHTEWLGPDEESIGREKAGVFRAGRPAVLGGRHLPASVRDTAVAIGARPVVLGEQFDALHEPGQAGFTFSFGRGLSLRLPDPALAGEIQRDNAAAALAAVAELGLLPAPDAIARALTSVRLAGRFERHTDARGVEWVLDVAHNPPAARNLAANLTRASGRTTTYALVGILADKDARSIAHELSGCFAGYVGLDLDGERGRSAAALAPLIGTAFGDALGGVATVAEGMALLAARARDGERIVVFGSFHVVGPALEWLRLYLAATPTDRP